MNIAEYYDSVASFWDLDFAESKPSRVVAATVSVPRGGACVLDIGCGNGAMFLDLLEAGACEIDGVDISGKMADAAREKFCFDPRIHVTHADYMELDQGGYDLLISFNSYHLFPRPGQFLQKAHQLLHPNGRLTVAFPFDRDRTNTISAILPAGLARGLLPAEEEAVFWNNLFDIDCICDNSSLFLLSGVVK